MKINIRLITIILFISLILQVIGCSEIANKPEDSTNSNNIEQESITKESEFVNSQEECKEISVDEAYKLYKSGNDYIFIDVRSKEAYTESHVKGALSIPVTEIRNSIDKIPKDKILIVYCTGSGCSTSQMAAEALIQYGFTGINIMGGLGILEWNNKGYPVE